MPNLSPERTYAEALSLDANEVFHDLLRQLEADARDGLVAADAENAAAIRDYQAMARAVVRIRDRVRTIIAVNNPKPKPGLA